MFNTAVLAVNIGNITRKCDEMQARADYIDYNTSNLCDEYNDCSCCADENICMQAYNHYQNGFDVFQLYADGESDMNKSVHNSPYYEWED